MSGLVAFSKTKQSNRNISQANETWSGFYSYEIPSSLLINALRLEEFNLVNRKDREDSTNKLKLQVRGQEIANYQPEDPRETSILARNKTLYNNNIKKIREFLQQHQNFKLPVPEKVDADKPIKDSIRKMFKLPENQSKTLHKQKQSDPTYFEQIILKTPTLFNRIISAYNREKYEAAKISANESLKKRKNISQSRKSVPCLNEQSLNAKQQQNKMDLIKMTKYYEMNYILNLSNNIFVTSKQDSPYRAYICKGNNGILVKTILKSRPWWTLVSAADIQTCNLVWTEWKRTRSFDNLRAANPEIQRCSIKSIQKKESELNRIIRLEKYDRLRNLIQYGSQTLLHKRFNMASYENMARCSVNPQSILAVDDPTKEQMMNHVEGGLHLHSKKLLFKNLSRYYRYRNLDPFDYVPVTYLIRKGLNDPEFQAFCQHYQKIETRNDKPKIHNIWICKPGENSNRGNGIHVLNSMDDIKNLVTSRDGTDRTLIIQKYIDYPFLYFKRKFDIRCYLLLTTVNGILKAYWFNEGYIRTSSKEFSIKNIDNKLIHLTNDAIQKKGDDYGKFEGGNKVSFLEFQKYLDSEHPADKLSLVEVFSKMKNIALDLVLSVQSIIHPKNKQFCFELFGLDFMVDSRFRPFLIEANSNPCLQVCGPVLGRLIPALIENTIRIAIDPLFPPPKDIKKKLKNVVSIQTNKFQLIYDQTFEYRGYPISIDEIEEEPEYENDPTTE